MVGAFLAKRADVVVVSGGLGPTADDLTRAALAEATATELIHSPEALTVIRERFARRGRPMPSGNEVQALQLFIQHTIEAIDLVRVAGDAIGNPLRGKSPEMVGLASHRPQAPNLPVQPLFHQ